MLKLVATNYIDESKQIIFEDRSLSQKAGNKLWLPREQKTGYKEGQKDISKRVKKRRKGVGTYIVYEKIVQILIVDVGIYIWK